MADEQAELKAQADTVPNQLEAAPDQKVQLDIDDAPFLMEQAANTASSLATQTKQDSSASAEGNKPENNKKKLIILGAGLLLFLAVGGGAAYFLLSKEKPPEPPVIVVKQEPPVQVPTVYNVTITDFFVELKDSEQVRHFLRAGFVATTTDPLVYMEMMDKQIVLRDSIYYYLSNQNFDFLRSPANSEQVRRELTAAVNEYLIQGNIDEVLFDIYLMK